MSIVKQLHGHQVDLFGCSWSKGFAEQWCSTKLPLLVQVVIHGGVWQANPNYGKSIPSSFVHEAIHMQARERSTRYHKKRAPCLTAVDCPHLILSRINIKFVSQCQATCHPVIHPHTNERYNFSCCTISLPS
jgi:hypothetical protein